MRNWREAIQKRLHIPENPDRRRRLRQGAALVVGGAAVATASVVGSEFIFRQGDKMHEQIVSDIRGISADVIRMRDSIHEFPARAIRTGVKLNEDTPGLLSLSLPLYGDGRVVGNDLYVAVFFPLGQEATADNIDGLIVERTYETPEGLRTERQYVGYGDGVAVMQRTVVVGSDLPVVQKYDTAGFPISLTEDVRSRFNTFAQDVVDRLDAIV